jgi:hypothetical protein
VRQLSTVNPSTAKAPETYECLLTDTLVLAMLSSVRKYVVGDRAPHVARSEQQERRAADGKQHLSRAEKSSKRCGRAYRMRRQRPQNVT